MACNPAQGWRDNMKKSYFVSEGPDAKALIDEANAKIQLFTDAVQDFVSGFPNNVGAVHRGVRGPVIGIGIHGDHLLSPENCKTLGLNPNPKPLDSSWYYTPNRRTKAGKNLQRRMDAINKLHIRFSDYVLKQLNVNRLVHDAQRHALVFATAGSKDGKLFLIIPGTPDDDAPDEFPTLPDWFRKPEGDEFEFFLR